MRKRTAKIETQSKELDMLIQAYTDMGYSLKIATWMANEGIKEAMGGNNGTI